MPQSPKLCPGNEEPESVTRLLVEMQHGSHAAEEALLPLIYDELRRMAANYMRREKPDHLLQATALVHEAYLHLVDQSETTWKNRAHFFGVAAQMMRRILVDHARSEKAWKRGAGAKRISLDQVGPLFHKREVALDELDDALRVLEEIDPRQGRIVELRFFGGLTTEETAEVIGVSATTIEREWRSAKAWLYDQLKRTEPPSTPKPENP